MTILTPEEVAERWHCSVAHVRKMLSEGELPGFRLGGKLWRTRLEDVEAFERAKPPAPAEDLVVKPLKRVAKPRFDTIGLSRAMHRVRAEEAYSRVLKPRS